MVILSLLYSTTVLMHVLLYSIQKSVNRPAVNLSRPSTSEHSQLSARERAGQTSSRQRGILAENESFDTVYDSGLTVDGQGLEAEKLTRAKEERAQQLREELERGLDTNSAVRRRRRYLAEV